MRTAIGIVIAAMKGRESSATSGALPAVAPRALHIDIWFLVENASSGIVIATNTPMNERI
jgi:hypothetical protein